eukprot:5771459-Amphidinium_carterae.1
MMPSVQGSGLGLAPDQSDKMKGDVCVCVLGLAGRASNEAPMYGSMWVWRSRAGMWCNVPRCHGEEHCHPTVGGHEYQAPAARTTQQHDDTCSTLRSVLGSRPEKVTLVEWQ